MKRFVECLLTAVLACLTPCLHGQEVLSDEAFRTRIRAVVSEGNRAYDRSLRHEIRAMADSVGQLLLARSRSGRLNRTDSLEFTADLFKLRGDYHYENGAYEPDSYAAAAVFFREAMRIYASVPAFYGHLQYAPTIHRELAQLFYKTGNYEAALDHVSEALEAYSMAYDNLEFEAGDPEYEEYLDILSQAAICNARLGNTELASDMIGRVLHAWPVGGDRYHEALRKQGKIFMLAGSADRAVRALPLYKAYMEWSRADALARFAGMDAVDREGWWMRMRPFFADCYQLENADPAFLYDVALFSKGALLQLNRLSGSGRASREALATLQYTWQDVQERLPEGASAIEFIQYEKDGRSLTGALVLGKQGPPQWIAMMSAEEFDAYSIDGRTNASRLNSVFGNSKNALFDDPDLRRLIWNDTLCEALGTSRRVYFAPDGYLHRLPIEYMLPESLAGVEAFRLTSTRRLMEETRVNAESALIVGGVRYGSNTKFNYLPYSRVESDSVYRIRSCARDTLLVGMAATEKAFRELCGRYPVVTVSTHGFFGGPPVPQGSDLKPCLSDESLSRSVIILAGTDRSVADPDEDGEADGILSAREIAGTDMSHVDLVVLSACQTGLGPVTADGIYGIQRGLKLAGVGCLLVSLWNVDDEATCRLMTEFHRHLKDMPPHQAFQAARAALMDKDAASDEHSKIFDPATLAYRIVNKAQDHALPQYVNAFVLIDAID